MKYLAIFLIVGSCLGQGLKISQYPNTTTNGPGDLILIARTNDVTKLTNYNMLVTTFLSSIATNIGLANTNYVISYTTNATNSLASTNYVNTAASNLVRVAAGANITVTPSGSGGVETYTVSSSASYTALNGSFDNIVVTNAINRIQTNMTSTSLTAQIDISSGPSAYYWTNMVTNITCQLTNMWTAGVSNRVIDFYFTGATNNGPNFTVTFTTPNPAGVNYRWGVFSVTNGATSFSVTNNHGAGASLSVWGTNVVEAYYSPVL